MTTATAPDSINSQRAEAADLIRALCTVAGDETAVVELLENYASAIGVAAARGLCAASLAIVFGSCLTQPVPLDLRGLEPGTTAEEIFP